MRREKTDRVERRRNGCESEGGRERIKGGQATGESSLPPPIRRRLSEGISRERKGKERRREKIGPRDEMKRKDGRKKRDERESQR